MERRVTALLPSRILSVSDNGWHHMPFCMYQHGRLAIFVVNGLNQQCLCMTRCAPPLPFAFAFCHLKYSLTAKTFPGLLWCSLLRARWGSSAWSNRALLIVDTNHLLLLQHDWHLPYCYHPGWSREVFKWRNPEKAIVAFQTLWLTETARWANMKCWQRNMGTLGWLSTPCVKGEHDYC